MLQPRMNGKEIELLNSYLIRTEKYFEFGTGGSTVNVNRYYDKDNITNNNITKIISVDSCEEWIEKTKLQISPDNLKINTFLYIDINADCDSWGKPKDKTLIENWPKYSQSINNFADIFDTILVDGRFRSACCLRSIRNMDEKSVLFLHDCDRKAYSIVFEFFDIISKVESLCVLKKKKCIDNLQLNKEIEKYEYDYA